MPIGLTSLSSAAASESAAGYLFTYFNHDNAQETSRLGVGCSAWLDLIGLELKNRTLFWELAQLHNSLNQLRVLYDKSRSVTGRCV
jgi:hypothetical protein